MKKVELVIALRMRVGNLAMSRCMYIAAIKCAADIKTNVAGITQKVEIVIPNCARHMRRYWNTESIVEGLMYMAVIRCTAVYFHLSTTRRNARFTNGRMV